MRSAGHPVPVRRRGRAPSAALVLLLAALPSAVPAQDYDWSNPGAKETGAVLEALRRGGEKALRTLLSDGLEADQLLPEGGVRVPVLSLAAREHSLDGLALLVEEGADLDAMSTGRVEDRESYQEGYRRLSP